MIQLIGTHSKVTADNYIEDLIGFYRPLFPRLTSEVNDTGDITRYISFQSKIGKKEIFCFLGIEVEAIKLVPKGMSAWQLTDNKLFVTKSDGSSSQHGISWCWMSKSSCDKNRYTGEFDVSDDTGVTSDSPSMPKNFWMSGNAYIAPKRKDSVDDEIHLVDYDLSWPEKFEQTASWLRENLPENIALRIEHYGSTAIPGMTAKPIIDILVEIPSFEEAKPHVLPLFNNPLWEYWWYGDHMIFIRRKKLMGTRDVHVHLAPNGHKFWEGLIFRDYLIKHTNDALRYAKLKQKLAKDYRNDRERYTDAKTEFVNEILTKASISS